MKQSATLFDEPTRTAVPEIVTSEHQALVPRVSEIEIESELSLIEQLTKLENAAQIFERRTQLIEQCRKAAIRATHPQDWVLFRDSRGEHTNAMLCGPGADLVAQYYGIEITNVRPQRNGVFEPQEERGDDNELQFVASCDAVSHVTGKRIENIESRRSSTEKFVGRGGLDNTSKLVARADLRAAVYTLLRTKATRILAAMTRVPLQVLEEAWAGSGKSSEQCRKGSGFGSSTERGASSVTPAEVKADAQKLRDEILSRVGGDAGAAKKLLVEITSDPEKGFRGFDSVDRLTKDWQVEKAFRKLKQHPTFGDGGSSENE